MDPAVQLDVLVGLVVAGAAAGAIGHLLVAAQAMLEQSQVPARGIPTVPNRAAEKVIVRVQVVAVGLVGVILPSDFAGQLGDDDFVGVNDQDPLVAERKMVEGPVLLLGIAAVEVELYDLRTGLRQRPLSVWSVLWLSTTKTSSAQSSAGRQRLRFSASFLTGTITLTGALPAQGADSFVLDRVAEVV